MLPNPEIPRLARRSFSEGGATIEKILRAFEDTTKVELLSIRLEGIKSYTKFIGESPQYP